MLLPLADPEDVEPAWLCVTADIPSARCVSSREELSSVREGTGLRSIASENVSWDIGVFTATLDTMSIRTSPHIPLESAQ